MSSVTETANEVEAGSFWQNRFVRLALLGLGIGVGLGALFLLIRPFLGPTEWHGVEFQSNQPVTNFTLTGPDEQPVSLVDFRAKLS